MFNKPYAAFQLATRISHLESLLPRVLEMEVPSGNRIAIEASEAVSYLTELSSELDGRVIAALIPQFMAINQERLGIEGSQCEGEKEGRVRWGRGKLTRLYEAVDEALSKNSPLRPFYDLGQLLREVVWPARDDHDPQRLLRLPKVIKEMPQKFIASSDVLRELALASGSNADEITTILATHYSSVSNKSNGKAHRCVPTSFQLFLHAVEELIRVQGKNLLDDDRQQETIVNVGSVMVDDGDVCDIKPSPSGNKQTNIPLPSQKCLDAYQDALLQTGPELSREDAYEYIVNHGKNLLDDDRQQETIVNVGSVMVDDGDVCDIKTPPSENTKTNNPLRAQKCLDAYQDAVGRSGNHLSRKDAYEYIVNHSSVENHAYVVKLSYATFQRYLRMVKSPGVRPYICRAGRTGASIVKAGDIESGRTIESRTTKIMPKDREEMIQELLEICGTITLGGSPAIQEWNRAANLLSKLGAEPVWKDIIENHHVSRLTNLADELLQALHLT